MQVSDHEGTFVRLAVQEHNYVSNRAFRTPFSIMNE